MHWLSISRNTFRLKPINLSMIHHRNHRYDLLAGALLAGVFLAAVIPVRPPGAIRAVWAGLLFTVCVGLCLGLALYALTVYLAARKSPREAAPQGKRRWAWLGYASPMLLSGLVYWLVLWPGLMSMDSYEQWSQTISGKFNNTHPVFHTLTILLLRKIWDSPAMITAAQILLLSLVAGIALMRLERYGAHRKILWLSAFLLALSPVNGSMAVTLWKDVPYSIATLSFFICVVEIVFTRGEWLKKASHLILISLLAILAALLRHNGMPVACGTLALFALVYAGQRVRLLASAGFVFLFWLVVSGPFYTALGIPPMGVRAQIPSHHVAAHVFYGTPLTGDEKAFLNQIMPLKSEWKYSCYNSEDTFYSPQFDRAYADEHVSELTQTFLALLRRNPRLDLHTLLCVSSGVWRITYPPGSEVRIVPLPTPKDQVSVLLARDFGIRHISYLPALEPWLLAFVRGSARPEWIWLVWRPALYFYLFLFGVAVKALREKDPSMLLLAAPLAIQVGVMFLLSINQDLRLHYPVILIGTLYAPYLIGDGGCMTRDA
jgi:hypothetical protein